MIILLININTNHHKYNKNHHKVQYFILHLKMPNNYLNKLIINLNKLNLNLIYHQFCNKIILNI